jgi:serine/threonine-protein kinase
MCSFRGKKGHIKSVFIESEENVPLIGAKMESSYNNSNETVVSTGSSGKSLARHAKEDPWIGKKISGVLVETLVSEGGMGRVYSGWHEGEGRRVAVKFLNDRMRLNPFFMRQFQKEANAIVALDHPGIVRCVDCRMVRGRPYFVMDMIEGLPLHEFIQAYTLRGLLLPLHIIARIIQSVAAGLDHAHDRGVLHLDVKPGNIILQSESMEVAPNGPIPPDLSGVLTDFGLARMDGTLKREATPTYFMGTPGYASPELIRGEELDARADVYSLGAVLYEMLAGEQPFSPIDGDPISVLHQHLDQPLRRIERVPSEANNILEAALGKRPTGRQPSAGALAAQFQDVINLQS